MVALCQTKQRLGAQVKQNKQTKNKGREGKEKIRVVVCFLLFVLVEGFFFFNYKYVCLGCVSPLKRLFILSTSISKWVAIIFVLFFFFYWLFFSSVSVCLEVKTWFSIVIWSLLCAEETCCSC